MNHEGDAVTEFKKGDTVEIRTTGKVVEVFDNYEFNREGRLTQVQQPVIQVAMETFPGTIHAQFAPEMLTRVIPPLPKKVGSIIRGRVSGYQYIYESSGRWVKIDQPGTWYREGEFPDTWDYEVVRDGAL